MTDLIDTTEMYLRTIFELEEEGVPVLRARIAERIGHSGPTVSQTVARMERDGLLRVEPDRSIELSRSGRERAVRVMRKHRLAERLLIDVIGLEYEDVHAEACRWEHVMSERVERKILGLLATHRVSPYGNPIPGLQELGVSEPPDASPAAQGQPLTASVPDGESVTLVLERLGEPLQTDRDVLGALQRAGLVIGAAFIGESTDGRFRLQAVGHQADGSTAAESGEVWLTWAEASHLFVRRGL